MFGKLSWEAIPFHEPIVMVTIAMIALGGLALLRQSPTSRSGPTCGPSG
jgi:hypothetical protein